MKFTHCEMSDFIHLDNFILPWIKRIFPHTSICRGQIHASIGIISVSWPTIGPICVGSNFTLLVHIRRVVNVTGLSPKKLKNVLNSWYFQLFVYKNQLLFGLPFGYVVRIGRGINSLRFGWFQLNVRWWFYSIWANSWTYLIW